MLPQKQNNNNNNHNRVSGCRGWCSNAISNYSVFVFAGTKLRRPKHKRCGKKQGAISFCIAANCYLVRATMFKTLCDFRLDLLIYTLSLCTSAGLPLIRNFQEKHVFAVILSQSVFIKSNFFTTELQVEFHLISFLLNFHARDTIYNDNNNNNRVSGCRVWFQKKQFLASPCLRSQGRNQEDPNMNVMGKIIPGLPLKCSLNCLSNQLSGVS